MDTAESTTTERAGTTYRISWRVIETHEVILTAERLAQILCVTVDELLAARAYDIADLGNVGLADALAEADDEDEHETIEFNREDIEVDVFWPPAAPRGG